MNGMGTDSGEVRFFHFYCESHAVHTEYLAYPLGTAFQIIGITDKDPPVIHPYIRMEVPDRILHTVQQRMQKIGPVQALEKDFTIAYQ